jgi:5-methylcytosine-specific restriction endonuclease McrA
MRPLGACGAQHGPELANHHQPGATRIRPANAKKEFDMETIGLTYEDAAGLSPEGQVVGPAELAVLGATGSTAEVPVHPQVAADMPRPSGAVSSGNVLRLLEWQQHRCALTGRTLTPETASLDHIMPVSCGGEHVMENAQVLHKDVNRAKTTMSNDEFIHLCREVVDHTSSEIKGDRL